MFVIRAAFGVVVEVKEEERGEGRVRNSAAGREGHRMGSREAVCGAGEHFIHPGRRALRQ